MNSFSLSCTLLKKVALLAFGSVVLVLAPQDSVAQTPAVLRAPPTPDTTTTYTSDTNIADFTSQIASYATFSNYSAIDGGCGSPTFMPTSAELATTGCRVYTGTDTTGLPAGNNWILATFASPVSTIVVFPNIDHYGDAYDGYQYQIYGSNDGSTWTFLFDVTSVTQCSESCAAAPYNGEPFTLGSVSGTAPTSVNNVLTPQSVGLAPACSGDQDPFVPCAVGYIAQFTFSTAYQYYAFGASTFAANPNNGNGANTDQELSAVGTPTTVTQTFSTTAPTTSTFNSGANQLVQQTMDLSTAPNVTCNGQEGNVCPEGGLNLTTTNMLISSDPAFPPYVIGTPLSTAQCLGHFGNGSGSPCSLYVNSCFGGSIPQAQADDFYCPRVPPPDPGSFIGLMDTWDPDPSNPKPDPSKTPGTTFALADFSPSFAGEAWTTSSASPNPVCNNANGTSATSPTPPAPVGMAGGMGCDFTDTLVEAYGDQTTTRGKSPSTKGWLISLSNVYMPLSNVFVNGTQINTPANFNPAFSANLWFKSPFNLSFVVNPACPSPNLNTSPCPTGTAANNYFVPAPVAGENYDVITLANQPGPNQTPSSYVIPPTPATPTFPSPFNTENAVPVAFAASPNPVSLQDGQYYLQYGAGDNVGIVERWIFVAPAVGGNCPVPQDAGGVPVPGSQCYITEPFEAQLNVDSTPPTITFMTPPSTTATYAANSKVPAKYSCADALSGPAMSTAAPYCIGTVANGANINTVPNGVTTTYNFSVTGTDIAGNSVTQSVPYNVSCHYVSFGVKPSSVTPPAIIAITASAMDCKSASQSISLEFIWTGPVGKSCAITKTVMFTTPYFTIPAGTSKSITFPYIIPKSACSGTHSLTTDTFIGGTQVDSTTASLQVL